MPDVMKNPRVQALLRELGDADRLTQQLGATPELVEAQNGLLRDLGRAVMQFASQYAAHTLLPVDDGSAMVTHDLYTDEVPAEDDTDWYTTDRSSSGPLFDPGDILDDDTDIPESDPVPAEEEEDDEAAIDMASLDYLESLRHVPTSAFYELFGEPAPTWAHHVEALVELLALPDSFADSGDLAVEASKVQWAVGELETRLAGMPHEVQVAFVGLLAARAQLLKDRLEVDVGPRLALDRLSRYRFSADLPAVAGLSGTQAESGDWVTDIVRWWALLHPELNP